MQLRKYSSGRNRVHYGLYGANDARIKAAILEYEAFESDGSEQGNQLAVWLGEVVADLNEELELRRGEDEQCRQA